MIKQEWWEQVGSGEQSTLLNQQFIESDLSPTRLFINTLEKVSWLFFFKKHGNMFEIRKNKLKTYGKTHDTRNTYCVLLIMYFIKDVHN